MIPSQDSPALRPAAPERARRGFALILVILVMLLASLSLAWSLNRAALESTIVERQVEGYRRHHELLGILDMLFSWLSEEQTTRVLGELAYTEETAYEVALPNGVTISATVADAQGRVPLNLDEVTSDDQRDWLVQVIARVPEDRGDLTRRIGPLEISFNSAPDEVLEAIAGEDTALAAAMKEIREEQYVDQSSFPTLMGERGADPNAISELSQRLTFNPSLWRLDVTARDEFETRKYAVTVEANGNIRVLRDWKVLPRER